MQFRGSDRIRGVRTILNTPTETADAAAMPPRRLTAARHLPQSRSDRGISRSREIAGDSAVVSNTKSEGFSGKFSARRYPERPGSLGDSKVGAYGKVLELGPYMVLTMKRFLDIAR